MIISFSAVLNKVWYHIRQYLFIERYCMKLSRFVSSVLVVVLLLTILPTVNLLAQSKFSKDYGSVYFLNFKPEADEAWQELAELYGEITGVDVKVETFANNSYLDILSQKLETKDAPTLFQLTPAILKGKEFYCLNLKNTDFYKELNNESYTLKDRFGRVCGVAYAIESYGIIVNRDLLEKAGYSTDDIVSFESLKDIAEDITARKDELGFAAFCSSGMDKSSDWRFKTHLANMPIYFEYQDKNVDSLKKISGVYLNNFKEIWDLYINNSTCPSNELFAMTSDEAREEFCSGQAVFYQNGSWEYVDLINSGFNKYNLVMLPLYIGVGDEENQGLCTGTENFWCVNRNAAPRDIKATLDFIYWCVTSEEGTKIMAQRMGFNIPFKKAAYSENIFIQQNAINNAKGKVPVSWDFTTIPSDEWKTKFGNALTEYAANQTSQNWSKVVAAFVNNWSIEAAKY